MTMIKYAFLLFALCTCTLAACGQKPAYRWSETDGNATLSYNNETIGKVAVHASAGINYQYTIEEVDDVTSKLTYRFTAGSDVENARITIDFVLPGKADFWMIPAVSYNGNHWGQGLEPKGAEENGKWRTYSYRRTPIPGIIYSETEKYAVATWSDVPPKAEDDFSCSVQPEDTQTTHRMIWPEEEMPVCYSSRDAYQPGFQKKDSMKAGATRTFTLYVNAVPAKPNHQGMYSFLNTCWKLFPHTKNNIPDVNTVWKLGIQYISESLWSEEGPCKGFVIGLMEREGKWVKSDSCKYQAGWCGQNISLGMSLLTDYLKNGNKESLEKGMASLDSWANNCVLPNGLFQVYFDYVLYKQTEGIIDACNLGTVALNYLQAYDLAKQCGYDRPNYKELAYQICDFVIRDQQENGCYAKGWKQNGDCYYRDGTVGCYMVPAMLEAYNQSKEDKYLESGKKAYNHYIKELRTNGFTTAGALDTSCIDKESSIPLLRSSLGLYKITNDKQYINDAIQTSYYLSTWLWHYDGVYPEDDNFTKYHWNTFGGTSVSVQHHHIDYYAICWIPEWLELSELTGDPQWKEKATAIWQNGCQMISDGSLEINGMIRPAGSQSEAYFESKWNFNQTPNRINNWLVAWPGALRLEVIRKLWGSDFKTVPLQVE